MKHEMITDKIKEEAKAGSKTLIFFDMDGLMTEFDSELKERIVSNEPGFYLTRRPLKSMLKTIKGLSKVKNITVGILSNCHYKEQKQDKITWLSKYAPFFAPENIHIVVLSEEKFEDSEKYFVKARYAKEYMQGYDKVYFFDDDPRILKAMRKALPEMVSKHISLMIK